MKLTNISLFPPRQLPHSLPVPLLFYLSGGVDQKPAQDFCKHGVTDPKAVLPSGAALLYQSERALLHPLSCLEIRSLCPAKGGGVEAWAAGRFPCWLPALERKVGILLHLLYIGLVIDYLPLSYLVPLYNEHYWSCVEHLSKALLDRNFLAVAHVWDRVLLSRLYSTVLQSSPDTLLTKTPTQRQLQKWREEVEIGHLEDAGLSSPPAKEVVPGVTIVKDMASAVRAYEALYKHKNKYFACDTEVAKIDIKTQGPVGNGEVSKKKTKKQGGDW